MKQLLTGMNGDAVAEILKRMPSTGSIPVVIYDGSMLRNEQEGRKILDKSGAREYVQSDDPAALLTAMEKLFA